MKIDPASHPNASLIIDKNELAAWHSLITEAALNSGIQLHENLESYLVFLMMRFIKQSDLQETIFTEEFIKLQGKTTPHQKMALQSLADKCLLFTGFYPAALLKKGIHLEYFVQLGKSAYAQLAEISKESYALLYNSLSDHFLLLMDVLFASKQQLPSFNEHWTSEDWKLLIYGDNTIKHN